MPDSPATTAGFKYKYILILKTNGEYFLTQHSPIGLCNGNTCSP